MTQTDNSLIISFHSLRHSQTTYNASELFTGQHDPELSKKGIKQASKLDLSPYNTFFSSEHLRCQNTLKLAGVDSFIIDSRLNEICMGNLEGTPSMPILGYKHSPLDYCPKGGESLRDAYLRIQSFLLSFLYLLEKPNVLICTSGGIIRLLKALEYQIPVSEIYEIKTHNLAITKHTLDINNLNFNASNI